MKWKHEHSRDTGNGAMIHTSRSKRYPSVVRVDFSSYSGRDESQTWFQAEQDVKGRRFTSAAAAQKWADRLRVCRAGSSQSGLT